MNWRDRITINPRILAGKPTIQGTRIAVEFVMELLGSGWSVADIQRDYDLTLEDVQACCAYASDVLQSERIYPTPSPIDPTREAADVTSRG